MKRSALEISFDIIKTLENTHTPTHIMYEANLNWAKLQTTLKQLKANDIIQVNGSQLYLTEKGSEALALIRKLEAVLA